MDLVSHSVALTVHFRMIIHIEQVNGVEGSNVGLI